MGVWEEALSYLWTITTADPELLGAADQARSADVGRLSVTDILRAYTSGAGHVTGTEATLDRGAPADLAVLSHDFTALGPEALEAARADLTLVGGLPVHDPHRELA